MAINDSRTAQAESTIKKHMLAAVAVGLVPLPLVDTAALTALQINLLRCLAQVYEVDFSSQLGKSAISTLLGGGIPLSLSVNLTSLSKGLPIFGLAAAAGMAVFGGASTYAMGKVFLQHFESGNTFLTFDPARVRAYYEQQFENGRGEVRKNFVGVKP